MPTSGFSHHICCSSTTASFLLSMEHLVTGHWLSPFWAFVQLWVSKIAPVPSPSWSVSRWRPWRWPRVPFRCSQKCQQQCRCWACRFLKCGFFSPPVRHLYSHTQRRKKVIAANTFQTVESSSWTYWWTPRWSGFPWWRCQKPGKPPKECHTCVCLKGLKRV